MLTAIYSVVPSFLGSHITVMSVLATVREYVAPVELYILGRLVFLGGVDPYRLVKWFLAISAVAAVYTIVLDVLPVTFWTTTMNMIEFVKQVQGISSVKSLWDISLVAQYGAAQTEIFTRAVGPFTHPVGTGHYFMLPLVLSIAWCFESLNKGRQRQAIGLLLLSLLFAAAVITPISRGSWIGAVVAILVMAVIYRRPAFSIAALALTGSLLMAISPYNYSLVSAWTGTDSSTQAHSSAISKGTTAVSQNPLGSGVGQADQFGQIFSGGEGIGENTYIALWVSVGPVGLVAFLIFMAGLILYLAATRLRAPPPPWIAVGSGAALLGYAAASMTSSALMRFTTSASVWLILGLVVGCVAAARAKAADTPTALEAVGIDDSPS